MSEQKNDSSLDATLISVGGEVRRARVKHPGNAHLLAALVEEVGELAKALLEREPRERLRAEAMQCACVAIRIMEEGDADFPSSVPPRPVVMRPARLDEHRDPAFTREKE